MTLLKKSFKLTTALLLIITLSISSCGTSRAFKGGLIGAGVGGVAGGLIGHKAGNTAVGVLIGAGIGGAAGALIGRHMDKQVEELQADLEGATVQRVGEGILITFNEGLQFDSDSYKIRSESDQNLNKLTEVLQKYEDTEILIEGHTDNTGSEAYNQTLSEKRANAVKVYLSSKGVLSERLLQKGYGENQPLSDNDTAEGRQNNRRVEVAIYANDKMKKMAEKGEL